MCDLGCVDGHNGCPPFNVLSKAAAAAAGKRRRKENIRLAFSPYNLPSPLSSLILYILITPSMSSPYFSLSWSASHSFISPYTSVGKVKAFSLYIIKPPKQLTTSQKAMTCLVAYSALDFSSFFLILIKTRNVGNGTRSSSTKLKFLLPFFVF